MSTPINYSKSILLGFAFCLALQVAWGSIATAQEIQWRQSLDEAKAEAAKTNRLVWLHFEADWCAPCRRLETFVFSDPNVIRTSDRNVVAVKVDVDENDLLVRQLGVPRIPYDIVMTPEGETIVNRLSPKISTDYLRMFNRLDRPLQILNTGDRESINAGVGQMQNLVEKVGGFRQRKSDLDLEGPSHPMAATTIEGQRLERGFNSADRAAEIRAIEAKLLKQKAKRFMVEEEKRLNGNRGPKVSDNPFFKGVSVNTASTSKDSEMAVNVNPGQVSSAGKSSFYPPAPPTIIGKNVKQVDRKVAEDLNQYDESHEFSFPKLAAASGDVGSKEQVEKTNQIAERKLTLPKFTAPKLPEFKDRSVDKSDRNDFAYAPIDDLKKALRTTAKPKTEQVVKEQNGQRSRLGQADKTQAYTSDTPLIARSDFSRPNSNFKRPASPAEKPRPAIRTDIAVPQPPVMVEGVVRIAEAASPAVEGRLVAAEQPLKNDFRVSRQQTAVAPSAQATIVQAQPAPQPQVTIVQAQPVPQPQVVINLNTGLAAQPSRNQGRIIREGVVAQATATTPSGNRARIVSADNPSAARSKYALKGKCPVTLLTQGQWVDGKKEIGCVHRDRIYLFASFENREAFLANPDQLSPLLAGFDPVIFEETGKLVDGEEQYGTFMGDAPNQRIVLFKTADTRGRFQKEPAKYINVVRSAMAKKAKQNAKLR